MTDPALLLKLHARLVLDHRVAFTGTGPRNVRPTLAGRTWLADHATYRACWRRLRRSGQKPEHLLRDHYGFGVSEDSVDGGQDTVEPDHDQPGDTLLRWREDRLREEHGPDEAA